jgi:N-acetylglucosaminyldiphosphoundecaprenol N-acetyl-beta-D-mannosaminyltransferase
MEENSFLFGLPFFAGSKEGVRKKIISLSQNGTGASVLFANAHVVVEASQNIALKKVLLQADLVVPDGVPITWVMKALGLQMAERYSGPDLMADLLTLTHDRRHFFLGSSPAVLEKIKNKFSGNAVGFYSPPFSSVFSDGEIEKQVEIIKKANPDFIWVGLGAPKQEKYVVEMAKRCSKGVWLAVGAAFDFYSGNKSRAPAGMQKIGMEWAYRMITEPRRLALRYFKTNPVFIRLAIREIARNK